MVLIVTKIRRVIKFKQSRWFKPYIDICSELRSKSTNDFGKKLFKLLPDSVYGKTMENKETYQFGVSSSCKKGIKHNVITKSCR